MGGGTEPRESCGPFSQLPLELSWGAVRLWSGMTRRHWTASPRGGSGLGGQTWGLATMCRLKEKHAPAQSPLPAGPAQWRTSMEPPKPQHLPAQDMLSLDPQGGGGCLVVLQ